MGRWLGGATDLIGISSWQRHPSSRVTSEDITPNSSRLAHIDTDSSRIALSKTPKTSRCEQRWLTSSIRLGTSPKLPHTGHEKLPTISSKITGNGAPGRIRTCDLRLRRATLYPAELRVRTAYALLTRFSCGLEDRIPGLSSYCFLDLFSHPLRHWNS